MYSNNNIVFKCQLSFAQCLFPVLLVFLLKTERIQLISFIYLLKSRLSSQFGCLLKASEVCCFRRFDLSFVWVFIHVLCMFVSSFLFLFVVIHFVFTFFILFQIYIFIFFNEFGFYTFLDFLFVNIYFFWLVLVLFVFTFFI